MTDITSTDWTPQDEGNISASPNGSQGGFAPNTIPPTIRAIRGAVKRAHNKINAILTTTGTATALVLTHTVAPAALVKGERYAFFASQTNTGAMTLAVNNLGAKAILQQDGTALKAGQVVAGSAVCVIYDGVAFRVENYVSNPKFSGTVSADAFTTTGALSAGTTTVLSLTSSGAITSSGKITGQRIESGTDVKALGNIELHGSNLYINSGQNSHVWYQQNGTSRAVTYYGPGQSNYTVNLYNTTGAFVRSLSYFEQDGRLELQGFLNSSGPGYFQNEVGVGDARYYSDGNILFKSGMASSYGNSLNEALNRKQNSLGFNPVQQGTGVGQTPSNVIKIGWSANSKLRLTVDNSDFGWRWPIDISGMSTSLKEGGSDRPMTFNWNGQAGTPDWLWGGVDGTNMYVYSPSNISVKNSAQLGGLAASDYATKTYVQSNTPPSIGVGQTWQNVSRVVGTTYQNTTGKPIQIFVKGSQASNLLTLEASVNNSTWVTCGAMVDYSSMYAIIPNNHFYRIVGSGSHDGAGELR